MAYQPQGFLFQPRVSLALHPSCPSFSPGLLLGPRTEDVGRSSSGSAFAPYSASAASSGFGAQLPFGGEPRAAAATLGSFASAGYDPSPGVSVDYHPFGPLGPFPYGDPTYRKNATRDATATLKAWLGEHRKNPYPTKGEKIMLAIITKMTLTQVSTWFANARRRLKKENKMTWTPRNRSEDEDEDDNLELERSRDEQEPDKMDEGPPAPCRPSSCVLMFRDDSGSDTERGFADPEPGARTLACPSPTGAPPGASPLEPAGPPSKDSAQGPNPAPKPKLWSLAEIATSSDKSRGSYEGEGPRLGPNLPASTPRTLFPHGPALPRHLYYASPFVHGYSAYGPLQGAEARLRSQQLQKGFAHS